LSLLAEKFAAAQASVSATIALHHQFPYHLIYLYPEVFSLGIVVVVDGMEYSSTSLTKTYLNFYKGFNIFYFFILRDIKGMEIHIVGNCNFHVSSVIKTIDRKDISLYYNILCLFGKWEKKVNTTRLKKKRKKVGRKKSL
jgi:hypothetical protein